MKKSATLLVVVLCYLGTVRATDEDAMAEWSSDQGDSMLMLPALVRSEREAKPAGGKVKGDCKYVKGVWGECDPKTNLRVRTLTLKKGDQSCEATKTIQKKCKKGKQNCQYEKGTWSACTPQNSMTRTDRLNAGSDSSCETSRQVTRPCKAKGKKSKKPQNNRKTSTKTTGQKKVK